MEIVGAIVLQLFKDTPRNVTRNSIVLGGTNLDLAMVTQAEYEFCSACDL